MISVHEIGVVDHEVPTFGQRAILPSRIAYSVLAATNLDR